MLEFLCVAALMAQMIAPYLIWRSRWNVPAHLNLGFCVTAYIIPGLLTDVWSNVSARTVDVYIWMNVLGALALIAGLWAGARLPPATGLRDRLMPLLTGASDRLAHQRVDRLVWIGIVGMVLAYAIMGFVPMFADDPLSAKQFKGDYFERYYRAAYVFRFSFSVLVACLPVVFTCWWAFKSRRSLMLGATAAALIGVSLARASTAIGLLTFLGFVAASRPKWVKWYLFLVAVVYPLGSAGYLLLGYALGIESLTSIYSVDSVFDIVASGAPDIFDQLNFLEGFYGVDTFTYGRTFFGGLVPGNFTWNPSVWTLTYDNLGADISETVSGGLRLSVALWGYANFGWPGVVVIPMLSGAVTGWMLGLLKSLPLEGSLVGAALVLTLYMTVGKQLSEFYMLSIHSLPSMASAMFLCFGAAALARWIGLSGEAPASDRH